MPVQESPLVHPKPPPPHLSSLMTAWCLPLNIFCALATVEGPEECSCVLPSLCFLVLAILIKVIRLICSSKMQSITQAPFNQLLHTPPLPDCCCVINYSPALCSGWNSWYLTCLLPLTISPCLCPGNLTCLLSLNFESALSLSACCLPGLPLRRLLPHSERRLCLPTRLPDCRLLDLWTLWIKFWTVSAYIRAVLGSALIPITQLLHGQIWKSFGKSKGNENCAGPTIPRPVPETWCHTLMLTHAQGCGQWMVFAEILDMF